MAEARWTAVAAAVLWWSGWCTASPPVRQPALHVNMTELELLEHVLRNESTWRLVLQERVKGIAVEPPHGQRFADAFGQDGDGGGGDDVDRVYDPRAVAVAVVPRYARVGSIVAFAARVVHRAIACHAMRHLSFQAHYLTLLVAGKAEPALVLAELSAFRGAMARVADKLALVPGGAADLDVLLDAHWDVVSLMQEDAVHHVRPKPYPRLAADVAEAVYGAFRAYVRDNCARPYRADRQLFADARVNVNDELLLDDVLAALVDGDSLVELGRRHAEFVQREFHGLAAESMPRALWTTLFYHARRLPPVQPLNRVNPFVTRQPGHGVGDRAPPAGPAVAINTVQPDET